jgi:hypothetical protein
MASVVLNDETVDELAARAAASGVTVDEYVKSLLTETPAPARRLPWNEVEAILDELSDDEGPVLPADFSRADIYCDHDSVRSRATGSISTC